jgi:protein-tyrosine-phosphatase
MAEEFCDVGIDISGHTSKRFTGMMHAHWDDVITVCDDANERCPMPRSRETSSLAV